MVGREYFFPLRWAYMYSTVSVSPLYSKLLYKVHYDVAELRVWRISNVTCTVFVLSVRKESKIDQWRGFEFVLQES